MPPILVPLQGQTLAGADVLLDDGRLERIWYSLMKKYEIFDEQILFATYLQESEQGTYAAFAIVSDHPKQRFPGQKLDTRATIPYSEWQRADFEHRHYVGVQDPAYAIFDAMLREHLTYRKNFKELI